MGPNPGGKLRVGLTARRGACFQWSVYHNGSFVSTPLCLLLTKFAVLAHIALSGSLVDLRFE